MDEIFIQRDVGHAQAHPAPVLGAYLVKGAGRYGQSYLMASVGERVIARSGATSTRTSRACRCRSSPSRHSAELMSRIVTDVNRLARLSSTVLVMTIRQVGDHRGAGRGDVRARVALALIALVVFPFVGWRCARIGRRLYRINKRSQEKVAELNVLLHEAFSGTKIVKAFGREAHEAERFDRVNRGLLSLALKDHRADELTEPLMEVLAALGIMGALWYGGHQVIAGAMTPGDFFSFTAPSPCSTGRSGSCPASSTPSSSRRGSVERVFEIIDIRPPSPIGPARSRSTVPPAIVFEDVGFRYAGAEELTLRDISLTVAPRRGRRLRRA